MLRVKLFKEVVTLEIPVAVPVSGFSVPDTGIVILLVSGPTLNTLPFKLSVGVISTVFPPLMLNVLGARRLKLGVEETV